MRIIQSAKQILRAEGIWSLIYKSLCYLYPSSRLRDLKYRLQYGKIAPRRKEIIEISPQKINYTLPSTNHSYNLPTFGVAGGDWDKHTKKIDGNDQFVTIGLRQRYIEGADWDDTVYYQTAVKYIQSNKRLTQLDSHEQSEDGLERYFEDLDDVFESLKEDGFREPGQMHIKDLPKVHINRSGEFILTQGHHRVIMCQILGIDTIFTRVGVRHSDWQRIRVNNKLDKISGNHPDHPDL